MSRDGRWIASSDDRNRMHLYDAATNRLLRSYHAPSSRRRAGVHGARFSPDSRQLAVVLESGSTEPVRLLDPNTMKPATKLAFPGGKPVWGVDVGSAPTAATWPPPCTRPTGRQRIPASPGYAVVWDLRSPSTPPVRVPTGTDAQGMALSPDGRTLYTAWPLTAYEVATGKQIWRREDVSRGRGSRRERPGDPAGISRTGHA